MAKNLFKKSYLHKNLTKIPFDSLWNTKGVFTTIRVKGSPPKYIFLNEHLNNLNKSLKKININFVMSYENFKKIIKNEFKTNVNYNHLLRIAINNKKISIDLRKCLKHYKFFKGILVNYKRSNAVIKNLYYKKILKLLSSINMNSSEIILFKQNSILEGCTTNIICVKNKKLYLPKNNYYFGITLKFITQYTKRRIFKTNITLKKLESFDEILLVGSGKGVVAVNKIPQINWINKSQIVYKELQDLYNSYINR